MTRLYLSLTSLYIVCLAGCAARNSVPGPANVVPAASEQEVADALGQIKALEGDWTVVMDGNPDAGAAQFRVSSGGSVVREIMFPGHPHEMTNLYHMDGKSVVVTHYCAAGNQPRMRAASVSPGRIDFAFDSVTNFVGVDKECMGGLTLVIKDKDNVRQEWRSYKNGKLAGSASFDLTRRQ